MYPLVSELAADGIPVVVSCRVLKLARQPYYRWLNNPVTKRELEEAYRANALFNAHRDDPEFGYRLLADEARDEGEPMSDRTAWRIASLNGWWSVFGKKRSKNGKKPGPAIHDDLCVVIDERGRERHQFVASRPNQLWLTDITEHKTTWIPVVVATPDGGCGDGWEEVHGCSKGRFLPVAGPGWDRSSCSSGCRCSRGCWLHVGAKSWPINAAGSTAPVFC